MRKKNTPHGNPTGDALREKILLYIKDTGISKSKFSQLIERHADISRYTVISFLQGKYCPRDSGLLEIVRGFRAIGGRFDTATAYAGLLAESPVEVLWDEIRSRSDEEIAWIRKQLVALSRRAG